MDADEITPGGSHVFRHQPREHEPALAQGDPAVIDAVSAHVERHIGPIEHVLHELLSPEVHLDLLWVAPREERPCHTLVTCGMSARPMHAPVPEEALAELCLVLPPDWPMDEAAWSDERHWWPMRLLKFLGRLPHEYDTWLAPGHTIPNDDPPVPYAPGTHLCGALIAPLALAPAGFDVLDGPVGPVRFHGVVPLHRDEMDFKLRKGTDALAALLDAAQVTEAVEPERPSVAPAPRRGLFRRRPR